MPASPPASSTAPDLPLSVVHDLLHRSLSGLPQLLQQYCNIVTKAERGSHTSKHIGNDALMPTNEPLSKQWIDAQCITG